MIYMIIESFSSKARLLIVFFSLLFKLTPSVVQGLHQMIQYMQGFDFQSALGLHAHLVATSNFTEISGFMPGIKVLIQSCQQMNVTL